jgi:hypothetical protein
VLIAVAGDLDLGNMIFFCQRERPLAGDLLLDALFLEGLLNFVNHGYIIELRREKGFTMMPGQLSGDTLADRTGELEERPRGKKHSSACSGAVALDTKG